MICEDFFNSVTERAKKYKYSSMSYIDFDECKHAEVLFDCDDLILMRDSSKMPSMLYFATDDFEALVKIIAHLTGQLRLHFVPKEFAAGLKEIGFTDWGEYVDFFNTDLSKMVMGLDNVDEVEYLGINDCDEVSRVSKKCMLQSRGFEGETSEWFAQWLNENKVFVLRKNSAIVGYCCVSIYNKGTTLWIRELAVDPVCQSRGLGKKLMAQAIKYGVESGAVKGFLAADVLNENAIALYNKYGFYADNAESELQMIRQ